MVIISSDEENEQVLNFALQVDNQDVFIGLYQNTNSRNYSEPDGGWEWVYSDSPDYWNWSYNEPSNGNCSNSNNCDTYGTLFTNNNTNY